ncbi:hypothetical protein IYC_04088 [Clostridium sporogenes PA 3679]|nr:hypothetical protein IYC_04088 [Clostridium sporogenes PA 3679]
MRRTFVVGEATEKYLEVYNLVKEHEIKILTLMILK